MQEGYSGAAGPFSMLCNRESMVERAVAAVSDSNTKNQCKAGVAEYLEDRGAGLFSD
jgi:hypothetical protein